MRVQPGFAVSTGAHVALLAISVFGLTAAHPLDAGQSEAMPIELITPTEFDQLTKGTKTSKVIDKPPQIKTAKLADAPPPEDQPELKEAKQEVKAPPPPPPPPMPAPEQKTPEPTPPAPPKQAEAKPVETPKPPEAKPKPPEQVSEDALPKQKPAEKQQDQPEQKKAEEQKPTPPKVPEKKPPPPKIVEQKPKPPEQKPPERSFNANKIAALLDKREPTRVASASSEVMPETTAGIPRGTAAKLSLSQRSAIDGALRQQISPCWNPPIGASGADGMKVMVRFQLNADGTLDGEPTVVSWQSAPGFQAAADSALRAVRRCSPLRLPADAYDYWRDVQINFDPKDMLGG